MNWLNGPADGRPRPDACIQGRSTNPQEREGAGAAAQAGSGRSVAERAENTTGCSPRTDSPGSPPRPAGRSPRGSRGRGVAAAPGSHEGGDPLEMGETGLD